MRKIALAVAAAALLAAAGCGSSSDGGGDSLSKEEYQASVIEVGSVLETSFDEIAEETTSVDQDIGSLDEASEAFGELAASIDDAVDALDEAADNLDGLDPPEEAESANSDLADGLRALAADLEELSTALEGGDFSEILELGRQLQAIATSEAGKQIEAAIEELRSLGFEVEEESSEGS